MKQRIALKVTVIYAIFGGLWILFSDTAVEMFVRDVATLTRLQMIKGWFFIFCTALIFYMLIRRYTARIIRSEEASRVSERRYRGMFEDSPISLWEEDFSAVKKHLGRLRDSGITDFRTYFETHPEPVRECAELVKIVDVNKETLKMFQAESKEALLANLVRVFGDQSYEVFREQLISLAEGK